MRWIVARSLRFRWLGGLRRRGAAGVRVLPDPQRGDGRVPRVRPADHRGADARDRELLDRGRGADHDPDRGRAERDRGRSTRCAPTRSSRCRRSSCTSSAATDRNQARQLVQERLAGVTSQLPQWASPPFMMPALSSTSRILKIGLTSDEVSPIDMSAIAYWKIRQRLTRVPGVAQVLIYGERLKQRHVQVDPRMLAEHGISLNQVMETTANSLDAGVLAVRGGVHGRPGRVRRVERPADERPQHPADRARRERSSRRCRSSGATAGRCASATSATWSRTRMPLWGDAGIGGRDGLMLIVQKVPGANTLEVTKGVEKAHGRDEAGPARHRGPRRPVPARHLHRHGARQPDRGDAARDPARGPDPGGVPVRVADGVHQPARDPALARGRAGDPRDVRRRSST